MHAPIKNMKLTMYPAGDVTQWFGENVAMYQKAIGTNGHNGIDIVRPHGEPMYAIEDGTVVSVKNDAGGFGKHLRIISNEKNRNGYYHEWTYGHNSINLVKVGDKVTAGQHICNMGNTGFVVSGATPYWKVNPYAGTHLHLGLREVKRPRIGGWSYEGSKIRIEVINYDNGFKGAIDPYNTLAELTPEEATYRNTLLTLRSVATTLKNLLLKK